VRPPAARLASNSQHGGRFTKHSYERAMDEARTGSSQATPKAKDALSVEVALAWEEALERAHTQGTRRWHAHGPLSESRELVSERQDTSTPGLRSDRSGSEAARLWVHPLLA